MKRKNKHRARLWTSPYILEFLEKTLPFSVWTRWLLLLGLLGMLHHYQMSLGGQRASITLPTSETFLTSVIQNCLKCVIHEKSFTLVNNSGKECIYLIPSSKKCNFIKKAVELTWKFKLAFIFCQHTIQAIT